MAKICGEYFAWICRKISAANCVLTRRLHEIPFRYFLPMDGNRESDGVNLRYRFGYECGVEDYIVAGAIDIQPCSVLEMMAALCIKCEEQIMHDPEYGDRTGVWFREMLRSLGLSETERDICVINEVVDCFLDGRYFKNGKGGLFTVDDPTVDMRRLEIWYQMNRWLEEFEERRHAV